MTPTRDWLPPLISDFLQAGTRKDERAYPPQFLQRGWKLIQILLQKSEAMDEPKDDPMPQTINSSKGRAIEALFNHALRVCRLGDKEKSEHATVWAELRPVFEAELAKCRNANYEFSTLAGSLILNLMYLDKDWLRSQMNSIFPSEFKSNCICAMEGLSYAQASQPLYMMLIETGILEVILPLKPRGRYGREKLIQRIVLGYLWGVEELDSPRFAHLFGAASREDLEHASSFLWTIGKQDLTAEQVERIMEFWERCMKWSARFNESSSGLLSSLSRLAVYLDSIGPKELPWLLEVAPHVRFNHNADHFIEELERLAESSPGEVAAVLNKVLDTYSPTYDFHDRLKNLLKKLAAHGKKPEAIVLAERLRKHLPQMLQVYKDLSA